MPNERSPLIDPETADEFNVASLEEDLSDSDFETEPETQTIWTILEKQRLEWVYWIDTTTWYKWWDILDLILNLLLTTSYIVLTNHSLGPRGTPKAPPPPPQIYEDIDFWISFALMLQWIPRTILCINPTSEIRTLLSISTLISTLSTMWVYSNIMKFDGTFLEGGSIVFLYPFRFVRLHGSFSRCFTVGKKGLFAVSPIKQKVVNLALSILTTLLAVTALVHILLYKVQKYYDLTFFDIFYTITVSATSGLSTEIVPDNLFSRIITVGIMVVGATFLPPQISALIQLVNNTSAYAKPYDGASGRSHIVVVGNLELVALRGFLKEFFSVDHGPLTMKTSVVLLNPAEPAPELSALLTDPVYSGRVNYVKGSPISFRSLEKVKLREASAVFVLSGQIGEADPFEEDAKTVMRCVSLRRYHKRIKIFAQILLPRNKVHLEHIATQILCIDEFKLGMLSQNCLSPGFTCLMYLLTNSFSERTIKNMEKLADQPWKRDYLKGSMMEIYEIRLSHLYRGLKFHDAVELVYRKHHGVLFALDYEEGDKMRLFPKDVILRGGERGYLISMDSDRAGLIGNYHQMNNHTTTDSNSFWSEERLEAHFKRNSDQNEDEALVKVENALAAPLEEPISEEMDSADFTIVKSKKQLKGEAQLETETPSTKPREAVQPDNGIISKFFKTSGNIGDFELGSTLPSSITGHVLFCSLSKTFPSSLAFFVDPYRSKEPNRPIVFLCPGKPSSEQWRLLSEYRNIYFIIGTPLLRVDLKRARVDSASRTVCLSDPSIERIVDRISDSGILLSLLNIQALSNSNDNFVTVEFIHKQNFKLIGQYNYFSASILAVSEVSELQSENLIPAFAGGHVFTKSMFHSILCQAYYDKNIIAILRLFLFADTQPVEPSGTAKSKFMQIVLPQQFANVPYGTVFGYFIKRHGCVSLGLYRPGSNGMFHYVHVNPTADTLIKIGDCLYLIGPKQPEF